MTRLLRGALPLALALASTVRAQDHDDMPGMAMPSAPSDAMPGMSGAMTMPGSGDRYAAGSGTSRQPVGDAMRMTMSHSGSWMLMAHGYVWPVYTDQGGPRGDHKLFATSMAMLEASRSIGGGSSLELRAMGSLDPLIGDRGYPNLFATGETAGGRRLIDRQHPHDLFMELSGRVDVPLTGDLKLFGYAGLPGEPALGSSAFMHRGSARLLADAPITHHWFDSTHISFGVATLGLSAPRWQLEASAFNGREPDEDRWDIERPRFSSWAVRGTWSPAPAWSASLSYGRLKSPERLEPGVDERRLIASAGYAADGLAVTAGWSRKWKQPGRRLDGAFAEASYDLAPRHTLFGRIERVRNDELFDDEADPLHGRPFTVARFTGGYGYALPLHGPFAVTLIGSGSVYAKPAALDEAYGRGPVSVTFSAKVEFGR